MLIYSLGSDQRLPSNPLIYARREALCASGGCLRPAAVGGGLLWAARQSRGRGVPGWWARLVAGLAEAAIPVWDVERQVSHRITCCHPFTAAVPPRAQSPARPWIKPLIISSGPFCFSSTL